MIKVIRVIIIILIVGASGFFLYRSVIQKNQYSQHITYVRTLKNQWKFSPDTIRIPKNQNWTLKIFNEDDYSHGFFVQELGINQELPPGKETTINIKPANAGTYVFYCNVICGAGHYRMNGEIIVE